MKIKGIFNTNGFDFDNFMKQVIENVRNLQEDNQEVEIQYTTNVVNENVFYSAMIIGRVKSVEIRQDFRA